MNKLTTLVPVFVLLAFVAGMFSFPMASGSVGDTAEYTGLICVSKNNELIGCNHNLITTAGLNAVENYLKGDAGAAFSYLALGNETGPQVGDTALDNEAGSGLARAEATLSDNGNGNWSLAHTWTADGTFIDIGVAGIFNASSGETLLASGLFSNVTLNSGDTLSVNYTLAIA